MRATALPIAVISCFAFQSDAYINSAFCKIEVFVRWVFLYLKRLVLRQTLAAWDILGLLL